MLWPQTLALMAGTIAGGLIGAYVARVISPRVVRVLVVFVGAGLPSLSPGAIGSRARSLDAVGEVAHAPRHGAAGIGQRIDHGEMIGARHFLVAGLRHALAPGFRDAAALAQEFARFGAPTTASSARPGGTFQ